MNAPLDPARARFAGVPEGFRRRGFSLVISGPSGAGKSSLCRHLLVVRPGVAFSVSATTRPLRDGEQDGREYFFYDEVRFRRGIEAGEFVEWAEVHGRLYGTPRGPLDRQLAEGRVVLLDVDVQGGRSLRAAYPNGAFVFVYPPSFTVLEQRLRRRASDPPEVIERRLAQAPAEMRHYVDYDYVIVNEDLEAASAAVVAIHDAEGRRLTRLDPI
jgi:guanylate kinase